MAELATNLDVLFEFLEVSEPETIRVFAINRLPFVASMIGPEVPLPLT